MNMENQNSQMLLMLFLLASLNNKGTNVNPCQLFKDVGRDLNRFQDLMEIMGSLVQQERILKVQKEVM